MKTKTTNEGKEMIENATDETIQAVEEMCATKGWLLDIKTRKIINLGAGISWTFERDEAGRWQVHTGEIPSGITERIGSQALFQLTERALSQWHRAMDLLEKNTRPH